MAVHSMRQSGWMMIGNTIAMLRATTRMGTTARSGDESTRPTMIEAMSAAAVIDGVHADGADEMAFLALEDEAAAGTALSHLQPPGEDLALPADGAVGQQRRGR